MKKRYRVSWTEKHSAWVEAEDKEQAIEQALSENMSETCDFQEADEKNIREEEIEPEYDQLVGDR